MTPRSRLGDIRTERPMGTPHVPLRAAGFHIAEHGAPPSLGGLAEALGCAPQDLEGFGSVEGLLAALAACELDPAVRAFAEAMSDGERTTAARLAGYHAAGGDRFTALFLHAALEGRSLLPPRPGAASLQLLLTAELRRLAGLPGPADQPQLRGEAEIVTGLLADLALLTARIDALPPPGPDNPERMAESYARLLLAGAVTAMRVIHVTAAGAGNTGM